MKAYISPSFSFLYILGYSVCLFSLFPCQMHPKKANYNRINNSTSPFLSIVLGLLSFFWQLLDRKWAKRDKGKTCSKAPEVGIRTLDSLLYMGCPHYHYTTHQLFYPLFEWYLNDSKRFIMINCYSSIIQLLVILILFRQQVLTLSGALCQQSSFPQFSQWKVCKNS